MLYSVHLSEVMPGSWGSKRKWNSQKGSKSVSKGNSSWKRRKTASTKGSKSWNRKPSTNLWSSVGGFIGPDKFKTKLKYVQWVQCGAVPAVRNVYRGNSCFDPGFTTGSNQPTGFAALAAIYQFYRVYGSKIQVTPLASVAEFTNLSCFPSNSTSPFTVGTGTVDTTIAYSKDIDISGPAATPFDRKLTSYMSTAKIWGDSRAPEDSTYSAAIAANPAAPWYWVVDIFNWDGSNLTLTTGFHVEITYYVAMETRVTYVA